MILRTPTWTVGLLLAIALVPLGSAPTRAEYVLVIATATLFIATKISHIPRDFPGQTAIVADSPAAVLALVGLPLLATTQITGAAITDYTAAATIEMIRASVVGESSCASTRSCHARIISCTG